MVAQYIQSFLALTMITRRWSASRLSLFL